MKNMVSRLCASVLVTALAAAAPAALAQSTQRISTSNLTITVEDLNTADGIAAGYSARNLEQHVSVARWLDWSNPATSSRQVSNSAQIVPLQAQLNLAAEQGRATATGIAGGGSVEASIGAGFGQHDDWVYFSSVYSIGQVFDVLPNTALTIRATVDRSWDFDADVLPGKELSMRTGITYDFGGLTSDLYYGRDFTTWTDSSGSETFELEFHIVNDTEYLKFVKFDISTATTFESVTAVPEPSTWAMLGLGLAAVAGVARRQRRREGKEAGNA